MHLPHQKSYFFRDNINNFYFWLCERENAACWETVMAGCPHLKDSLFVILHKLPVKRSEKVMVSIQLLCKGALACAASAPLTDRFMVPLKRYR